jgi:L-ascorbate metabolism protein UlaG (beta-lactamase superfamily)
MSILYIVIILVAAIALFLLFSPEFGRKPFAARLARIKQSPQYKQGSHFDNDPVADPAMGILDVLSVFWERNFTAKNLRPNQALPSKKVIFNKSSGAFLTWFGHSTFLYELDGKKILFDPMLGKYAAPVPYIIKRFDYDLPASAEELPALDVVIISHDHYDHLDYGTIKILKNKTKRFIMPLGVGSHLERWGVPKENIIELDWWDETALDNITIAATPSQHFSGRSLTDRKKTLWASWVIKNKTATIFFGGDSGYFDGFKKIGQKYGPFDVTLLDSAQYNERWKPVHMVPEQSVQAHQDLQGKVFMPIHWSAFTLALHEWTEPIERAVAESMKRNIKIITPRIGQRFNVIADHPKNSWWNNHK